MGHIRNFPEDKELAKQYNAFGNFNIFDWREYLKYFPQDKELAKQYGSKNKYFDVNLINISLLINLNIV